MESENNTEVRRVYGNSGILVKLAAAALAMPEEIVRKALHPVVGKQTLQDVVAEAAATELQVATRVRRKLRGSYSHHTGEDCPNCWQR